MRPFLSSCVGLLVFICWSCGNDSESGKNGANGGEAGMAGDGAGEAGTNGGGGEGDAGSGVGGDAGTGTEGGMGGSAGSGEGGTSGTAGTAGTGGGLTAGSFYLLWSDLQSNAFITELNRQTGETIRDVPLTMGPSPWATDLAVAPDGTLRLMYPAPRENYYLAGIWIFDTALQRIDVNSVAVQYQPTIYAKRPDGTGRLWDGVNIGGVAIHRMLPLTEDDGTTSTTPILQLGADDASRVPTDYFTLPNGEGRVLYALPGLAQSRVVFLDQNEQMTPNFVEYDHPGVNAVSYAVYEDAVWTSFVRGEGGVVCAAASESEVVVDIANEGWGVGACRTFAMPAADYAFVDMAGPP